MKYVMYIMYNIYVYFILEKNIIRTMVQLAVFSTSTHYIKKYMYAYVMYDTKMYVHVNMYVCNMYSI